MKHISVFLLAFLIVSLFLPLYQVKSQELNQEWINRYVYDVDYGNGTHSTISHIGPQCFWNNETNEWQTLLLENHTDTPNPHYLVRNSHITAKVGLYDGEDAVLYYDPDYTRRICAERWNLQGYVFGSWNTLDKTFYSHEVLHNETYINVTGIFRCEFNTVHVGWLRISYILKPSRFLKHEVAYRSVYAETHDYRCVMTVIGIAGKKFVHQHGTIILNETQIEGVWNQFRIVNESNPSFQFFEERLDSLGHFEFNETLGEEKWINDYIKVVRLKEVTYWNKQLVRCDIVIGNYTLGQGETLYIDPDSSTWSVSASLDDCTHRLVSHSWSGTGWDVPAGDYSSSIYDYDGGMRFTGINIDNGATINEANITFICHDSQSGDTDTYFTAEDVDDGVTFSDHTDYDARSWISTKADWNITGGAWTVGNAYTSADISTVIQYQVNRAGWSSGNDLVIKWSDYEEGWGGTANRRMGASWNHGSYDPPELKITWTSGQTYNEYPSINLVFSLAQTQIFYGTYSLTPSINLLFSLASTINHITAQWNVNPSIILDFVFASTPQIFRTFIESHSINLIFAISSTLTPFRTFLQHHLINIIFSLASTTQQITGYVFNVNPSIIINFVLSSTTTFIQHYYMVVSSVVLKFVLTSTTSFIAHLYNIWSSINLVFQLGSLASIILPVEYATKGFVLATIVLVMFIGFPLLFLILRRRK